MIALRTKKKSNPNKRHRGYANGCHSEIEVSRVKDWTAQEIYKRSKKLIEFMQRRWDFSLTEDQMEKLIYVDFAKEER